MPARELFAKQLSELPAAGADARRAPRHQPGAISALSRFGESSAGEQLLKLFRFSVPDVVAQARAVSCGRPVAAVAKEVLS